MTLLAPAWLALLLLAGPLIVLHMRRRRRVKVSSLLLWRGVPGVARPSHALGRPPLSAALILQLLALVLLAVALARPAAPGADHLILLLDGSAAQDEARFAASVAEARRLLRTAAANEGAAWSLVLVTEQPRPLAARWPVATTTLADLGAALTPTDGAADWARAAALAARLAADEALGGIRPGSTTRTVLIGPSAAGLDAARALLPEAEAVPVPGGKAEAFVAARMTRLLDGSLRLTGRLVGLGEEARDVELRVTTLDAGGAKERAGSVAVPLAPAPAGGLAGDFDLTLEPGAPAGVLVSVGEATAAFVPRPTSLRGLYLGPGNAPLVRALRAVPGVELDLLPVTAALPETADAYGLVILDRVSVPRAPATSTWWLGSARTDAEAEPERLEEGGVRSWADEPLVGDVDWASLSLGLAWRQPLLEGGRVLVAGEAAPLLQLRNGPDGLTARLGFDVAASDWPARNSFPLFVRDLLLLSEPSLGRAVEEPCHAFLACRLPAGTVGIADPRGASLAPALLEHGGALVAPASFVPETAGLHTITDGAGERRYLAVNAFTEALEEPWRGSAAGEGGAPSLRALLLVALLLVLLAEAVVAMRSAGRPGLLPIVLRGAALVLVLLAATDVRVPLPTRSGRLVVAGAGAPGAPEAQVVAPHPGLSDLEATLDLAAALVPGAEPARIVLLGDGSETRGDVARAAARAGARGLRLDAIPAPAPEGLDALVRSVTAPALVLAGDRFELHALVHASAATSATVAAYQAGEVVAERLVDLAAGATRVSLEVTAAAPGSARYEVEVVARGDVEPANDRAGTVIAVQTGAEVLLVAADEGWTPVLTAALEAQGLQVTTVTPAAMPANAADLADHGAVMLMNVPALAFTQAQQLALEAAVHDLGLPLVLVGGEKAFGPGGYYETPFERLSPTSSLVPREAPELAMAFVLDRSNSMRQYAGDAVRLDIAKVAALNAHELLPEGARSTLIVFDSTARTLVPLGPAADDAAFRDAILELEPRGGTNLYPALVAAYEELADAGAASAHVIVMSDGLSQPGDFEGIMALMRASNITVSTIGIGPEADADQLREVARLGGGTFHSSADFSALPSIMAHEVLLQAGDLTEKLDTVPAWQDRRAAFLRAWPDELPAVGGFVPTSVKPDATLHLSVTNDDGEVMPLLASWRYGAGEVVAFTAHAAGPWTSGWLAADGYAQLWSHLLRQLARPAPGGAPAVRLTRAADTLTVAAGSPDVTIYGPGGDRLALGARQVGPDAYLATALLEGVGAYRVEAAGSSATLEVNYPAVLDGGLADRPRLEAVARATGGGALASLADVGGVARWHSPRTPVWPWLLLAALLALAVELTARYAPDLLFRPRKD